MDWVIDEFAGRTALTTLFLLIHSWYNVHFGLTKPPLESHRRVMGVFLVIPFVVWALMFVGFLYYGIKNPSLASNFGSMYCTFSNLMPAKVSSLFVIIITFSTIPIQASLGISLLRDFDRSDTRSTICVQTLKMVVRVLIFSFLILIGFAEGLIHLLTEYHKPGIDILLAFLPVSGVVIFGVQKDLFQAWKGLFDLRLKPADGLASRRSSTGGNTNEFEFGTPLSRVNAPA
ncbi:hypothetical protein PM082_011658 [Marasmius tenuissimus]|nr:hypothetical protein PM082_011658 [Marasmius tenuissimus]